MPIDPPPTPKNETFTWLQPGAWRKPCIVHVTMVAKDRQPLFGRLTHNGSDESAFVNPAVKAAVEDTLRRKAEAKHYTYTAVPVESLRYRFVALNEMARMMVTRDGGGGGARMESA